MIIWLIVAAAIGGLTRFTVEYFLPPVGTQAFPRATLIVNVVGTFLLGIFLAAPHDVRLVVGSGFCGALTTFSGVSLQLHRRFSAGDRSAGVRYLGSTLVLGLAAAAIGMALGTHLF